MDGYRLHPSPWSELMPPPPSTAALQEILERFLAGDPAAKEALITRANGRLMDITRKVLGGFPVVRQREETTAVLNEAYHRISSALDDVRPPTVQLFFGLVALQLRRVLLDLVRKMGPRNRSGKLLPLVVFLGSDETDGYDPPAPGPGPDGGGSAGDVREAVNGLPPEERQVIDLIFFNGLTQAEAAAIIGVHEDTVKRRWVRARTRLGEALAAYAADE
ncbi:MAG: hypothetical protein C0467_29345 [Planctomycetaceae bacterium]|nr:hypothetical protein [Planctomycetaceae bacterium]